MNASLFRSAAILVVITLFTGCAPFIENTGVNPQYAFDKVSSVGVYVVPTKDPYFGQLYSNLLRFNLLARGYAVVNLNAAVPDSVSRGWKSSTYRPLADSLRNHPAARSVDLVAVASLDIDFNRPQFSLMIGFFTGLRADATPSLALVDRRTGQLALGARTKESSLSAVPSRVLFVPEDVRFPLERSITGMLSGLPLCAHEQARAPVATIPVVLYVDNSYRSQFATTWRDRLDRRMVFVNDLYYHLLGVQFEVRDVVPWDFAFNGSLERSFNRMPEYTRTGPWLNLGVTLSSDLTNAWRSSDAVGYGSYVSTSAIVSAVPTPPGLTEWSSLEESMIIAHELAHALGAIHAFEPLSMMFPSATMGMELDTVNARILRTTKTGFLRLNKDERARQHIAILHGLFRSNLKNNFMLFGALARDIAVLNTDVKFVDFAYRETMVDSTGGIALVDANVSDTTLALGVKGILEAGRNRWPAARQYFHQAAERRPDLAELQVLLAVAAVKLDDIDAAKKHIERAFELGRKPEDL